MASIRKKILADGTAVFKCEIVIKKHGIVLHRESKTFNKAKLAKDWGLRREVELQHTSVYKQAEYMPIREVIERYIKEFKPAGRSKNADLLALMKRDICAIDVHKLNTKDLIKHIRERNKECQPQTAANDLIWLGTVIKTMRGVIDIDIDMSIFQSAREVLRSEGLIAKSSHRERLPTKAEIIGLSRHLKGTALYECWWFSLYSARRLSEITRLEWDDIDHDNKTGVLRDLKDPRKKGVRKHFKIPASAYKIIMRQPRISRFIFPYQAKTLSTYFTRECKLLGIKDLHFHDARHAATTSFFNRGFTIQQVQQITLHSTWSSLQRYCNLNPADLDI